MAATFPFTDDVSQVLSVLLKSASPDTVRAAILADPLVLEAFSARSDTRAGEAPRTAPLIAICEFRPPTGGRRNTENEDDAQSLSDEDGTNGAESTVIATTDPVRYLTRGAATPCLRSSNRDRLPHQAQQPQHSLSALSTSLPQAASFTVAVSCIVITARRRSAVPPLSTKDLCIQVIDLRQPLDVLGWWLQNVYIPILRTQGKRAQSLRVQMQDVVSGIHSLRLALPEVNLMRFVADDLLELCAAHPSLDVPHLVDRLGEQAKDFAFLRRVLQCRHPCTSVLPLESLLAGNDEGGPSARTTAPRDGRGETTGWVVQEHLTYWQGVQSWVVDIANQLKSVEWRLVHRLLGSRVETSYVTEYAQYERLTREYVKYLHGIPEKQLLQVHDYYRLGELVDQIFAAVMRPSTVPPPLVLQLMEPLTSEIASCWVRLTHAKGILVPLSAAASVSARYDGLSWTAASASTRTGAAVGGDPSSLVFQRILQGLRDAMEALDGIRDRYAQHVATLRSHHYSTLAGGPASNCGANVRSYRDPRSVVSLTTPSRHALLDALYRRCVDVRTWLEAHFRLVSELTEVFSVKGQLPGIAAPVASCPTAPPEPSCQRLPDRAATAVVRMGDGPGNELVEWLENTFERCVQSLWDGGGVDSGADEAARDTVIVAAIGPERPQSSGVGWPSSVLWDVGPDAQEVFHTALSTYQQVVEHCDERIASFVGTLLSSEQDLGEGDSTTGLTHIAGSSDDAGHRLFNIFACFRYISLEKVRRVVRGYESCLAERVIAEGKRLQEEFFSVASAKRETRLSVSWYHCSPLMAQVMWDNRLEAALRACVVKHDYVNECGWHRVLSFRNIEHYWRLDEHMAETFGFSLADLETPELRAGSVVHGTAYALAFLNLLHSESEQEWGADPYIQNAHTLVQTQDPASLQAARERLIMISAGVSQRARRADLQGIRSTLYVVKKRLHENILAWCQSTRQLIVRMSGGSQSPLLSNVVFRVATHGLATSKGDGDGLVPSSLSTPQIVSTRSRSPLVGPSGSTPSTHHITVTLPYTTFFTIAEDIRYAESIPQLLQEVTACSPEVQEHLTAIRGFVSAGEYHARIAQCLASTVNAYYTTVHQEDEMLVLLATDEYRIANQCLARGFLLRWHDKGELTQYAEQLAEAVQAFTLAVLAVRHKTEVVTSKVAAFHTRAFHPEAITQRVKEIRHITDVLTLRCVHTYLWVMRHVQPLLVNALCEQVKYLMHGWTLDFISMRNNPKFLEPATASEVFGLKPLRVGMRIVYKEVRLETPAAAWRSHWIAELIRFLGWVDALPFLHDEANTTVDGPSGRPHRLSDVCLGIQKERKSGYVSVLEHVPPFILAEPFAAIEQCISEALAVENQWRHSQHLLALDVGVMQLRFGTDLRRWGHALRLMRQVSMQVMDATQPNKLLGGVVILAADAQMELGRKLDQVSQFTLRKFKDVLEGELEKTSYGITSTKDALEGLDVLHDIKDTAVFMCEAPRVQREIAASEGLVALMLESEGCLRRLGCVFSEQWVSAAKVEEELVALKELMERRVKALQLRRPDLLKEMEREITALEAKYKVMEDEYNSLDSAAARVTPGAAQSTITDLHHRVIELFAEAQKVGALQEALGVAPYNPNAIQKLLADTQTAREVWEHVTRVYSRLNMIGATPFFEVVPRRLQHELQELVEGLDACPEKIRAAAIYQDLTNALHERLRCRQLIQDLRSDAMAPLDRALRHWLSLKQELHASWDLERLTVQDIWASVPTSNAAIFNDVLDMAQGEYRIEVQLDHIAQYWETFVFGVVAYKKQTAVVKGWDSVLEKLTDDLSTFHGIRASPYYGSAQMVAMTHEAETRLNRLRQVLEVLLEVQRRWVYLDGVFAGNGEVRQQLPHDTALFDRISRQFVLILPHIQANGVLPEVHAGYFLDDEKLHSTLERLLSQLTAVQRALTAYLDTQRRRFPRFFFVGDDALLEILGNSQDPVFMGRHLGKMFTALTAFAVVAAEAAATPALSGFTSHEGERIDFQEPVECQRRELHEWLRGAEDAMVRTLRQSTVDATSRLRAQGVVTLDWMIMFPAQVVCLALQISWVRQQEAQFASFDGQATASTTHSGAETASGAVLGGDAATPVISTMKALLASLADGVLDGGLSPIVRRKYEQVVTVAVYQRDVSRSILRSGVVSVMDFEWISVLRVYLTSSECASNNASTVECCMADARLAHSFEYVGVGERLVQTPLTDKCYLTLMQALHSRLGGSPVGPAGTGKTETVKALGTQLGRHVLVFNCDDTFDYPAMSRIFHGLCQVGAWGCFDEFNRLEERILSALSQQIQTIQESLRLRRAHIDLSETHVHVPLHPNIGVFITMNPGYAGRSKLPGNLKQLFRTVAMTVPDQETIAEVILFAQGFQKAELLSRKVVPLFRLCETQFSRQAHYDFGLRALKPVLIAAGELKRRRVDTATSRDPDQGHGDDAESMEVHLMLESILMNIAPKLVAQDVATFHPLLHDFFPDVTLPALPMQALRRAVAEVCEVSGLDPTAYWVEKICELHYTKAARHGVMIVGPSGTGKTMAWRTLLTAMVRVDPTLEVHAHVIDPKVLSKAELFGHLDVTTREWTDGVFTRILRRIVEAVVLTSDPLPLEAEPSHADSKTLLSKQYWVVFDGDVDPEWVENLNSVLDDNRVLTLPNGERLALPPSMHVLFETHSLRYATPATVSRCGMLWFSEGLVPLPSVLSHALHQLKRTPVADRRGRRQRWDLTDDMMGAAGSASAAALGKPGSWISTARGKTFNEYIVTSAAAATSRGGEEPKTEPELCISADAACQQVARTPLQGGTPDDAGADTTPPGSRARMGDPIIPHGAILSHPDCARIQETLLAEWASAFAAGGIIERGVDLVVNAAAYREANSMELSSLQLLESVFALLHDGIWRTFKAELESGLKLSQTAMVRIAENVMCYAVFWGLCSGLPHSSRIHLAQELQLNPLGLGNTGGAPTASMLDVEVSFLTGDWQPVLSRVPTVDILAEQVGANDTVIPTVDTCRHEDLLRAWLGAGRSALLCGPPGSGKTMSITSVLSHSPEYEAIFLNFSSCTTADTVLKALEQYCVIQDTVRGLVMTPRSGRKLLLFCDEINLPALNCYGTQVVLQLLRQLVERRGFFRASDHTWVMMESVQVVGACNPPTDPGRVPLSRRFLRWAPLLFVDFPTPTALETIYQTTGRAIMSFNRTLSEACAAPLTAAMVTMYHESQLHYTPEQQPHYLYSPRELSRWSRAIYEAIRTFEESELKRFSTASLVRLAVHEGLRVFSDRLVTAGEREWTDAMMDECFQHQFPEVPTKMYARPMLYTTLLSKAYTDYPREELRTFLHARLESFGAAEVSAPLVIYDAFIDHVVRIHRVLQQPLGHVLIAGSSGVGKTTLARLVAWLSGFSTFRLKVHRDYTLEDFENDLRALLRRSGCARESICFIFDESNIMQPSFLEYMNALLTSGEVPGLFDGEEWQKLMQDIREALHASAGLLSSSTAAAAGPSEVATAAAASRSGVAGAGSALPSKASPSAATIAAASRRDVFVDTSSETDLYRWFLQNIKENLHVVFAINPSSDEFSSRTVASPALFNRCTVDWLGDWNLDTLTQIAEERLRVILDLTPRMPTALGPDSAASKSSVTATPVAVESDAIRSSVAGALCHIHLSTQRINTALRVRQAYQGTFITPRHFSDVITHFITLYKEKVDGSTAQYHHFRNGLTKLDDTAKEVATEQLMLRANQQRMEQSSVKAQTMLDHIIAETEVARREKISAEDLRMQLQVEQNHIDEETKEVREELAEAEPALKDAELALATVKPEYLREIRAYSTPPPMVKRVLEAVCALMGERNSEDWDVLKSYIRRDDFLTSVKNFQPDDISEPAKDRVRIMQKDGKFTVEAAYRASKAAGPLLQWVFAQVQFAGIFQRVAPVRERILQLTSAREVKVRALRITEREIQGKEESLTKLKNEYHVTTTEIAQLQQSIRPVTTKCERATTILSQLLGEQSRWEASISSIHAESHTLLGDCVLSAAFLAYMGFYDERTRRTVLLPQWLEVIANCAIAVRTHLSVMEYLATPNERLEWEQHGLPNDSLCMENAVIMKRSQRYTLVIDPDGTAAAFLQKQHAAQKIATTSFSSSGYLKQLEMAIRFGYPIVLEDAEALDPAVVPMLNREVRRHGGRLITHIGALEADLSPTFHLFLRTRDVNYQPTPVLAGKVCLVAFTATLTSLQSQCLHRIVLHERPDADVKRTALLSSQGAYHLRLRVLEEDLLKSIANAEGSLLDNDCLIASLTQLKKEATEIEDSIRTGDASMTAILRIEARYRPVAAVASRILFALKRFGELSPYYRYDVRFILRALSDALPPKRGLVRGVISGGGAGDAGGEAEEDAVEAGEYDRIQQLVSQLFALVYQRAARGMFREDHLVLALRLAQLRSSMMLDDQHRSARLPDVDVSEVEWEWLLDAAPSSSGVWQDDVSSPVAASIPIMAAMDLPAVLLQPGVLAVGASGRAVLHQLLARPAFQVLSASLTTEAAAWKAFFISSAPHDAMDTLPAACFPVAASAVRKAFLVTLIIFFTRRDSFLACVVRLLSSFFDGVTAAPHPWHDTTAETPRRFFFATDAHRLLPVLRELSVDTPLLLLAAAGYDASYRVELAATEVRAALRVVAMGSREGTATADQYLADAMAGGGWVLLKNVHLAGAYADGVEKRLHSAAFAGRVHQEFRLFLTAETAEPPSHGNFRDGSPTERVILSASLLERAVVMAVQPPPGMKSALQQTYQAMLEGADNDSDAAQEVQPPFCRRSSSSTDNPVACRVPNSSPLQRLFLAAAWLHAVIMERLLYVPMGWTQAYEFNEVDFSRVLQTVRTWSTPERVPAGRAGSDTAAALPTVSWIALRRLVATAIYGGKVHSEFDQHTLNILSAETLQPSIFHSDHVFGLVGRSHDNATAFALSQPAPLAGFRCERQYLIEWIQNLPDGLSRPHWCGLLNGVARLALVRQAVETVGKLVSVQEALGGGGDAVSDRALDASLSGRGEGGVGGRPILECVPWRGDLTAITAAKPRWAAKVEFFLGTWESPLWTILTALGADPLRAASPGPGPIPRTAAEMNARASRHRSSGIGNVPDASNSPRIRGSVTASASSPPLVLAVHREKMAMSSVLEALHSDLRALDDVCTGKQRPTAAHRSLALDIARDQLPLSWSLLLARAGEGGSTGGVTAASTTVSVWLAETLSRAEHIQRLTIAADGPHCAPVNLGLLLFPSAFLSASKQQSARQLGVPLETLQPHVLLCAPGAPVQPAPATYAAPVLHLTGTFLQAAGLTPEGKGQLLHTPNSLDALSSPVGVRWSWAPEAGSDASSMTPATSLSDRLARQRPFQETITIPFYTTDDRQHLLEIIDIPISSEVEINRWYEHGVCLVARIDSFA